MKFILISETIIYEFTLWKNYETELYDEIIDALIEPFISEISSDGTGSAIESVKAFDENYKLSLENFLLKFGKKFKPVNQIRSFFRHIQPGEYFIFLPGIEITQKKIYELQLLLHSKNNNRELQELESNLGSVLDKYLLKTYGIFNHFAGNSSGKVCRFCSKTESETTFSKKAHSVSESLGNKKLVTLDECDTCNENFSRTIEPFIANFFSLYRVLYDVKGKKGAMKIVGGNFQMYKGEDRIIVELKKGNQPIIPHGVRICAND